MDEKLLFYRLAVMGVLIGFLPLTAMTYYTYRLGQRKLEIQRILQVLGITSEYRKIHQYDIGGRHFALAVLFACLVAAIGLATLLLGSELGLARSPNLLLGGSLIHNDADAMETYQKGALMAWGMGFLGAYLWGLQNIFRRYAMNDLLPVAYYHFGLRMITASVVALLIYHVVGGFTSDQLVGGDGSEASMAGGLLLVTVFLVGMFPQRGIRWLGQHAGSLMQPHRSAARELPLEMIEGMTAYDKDRLAELGIDSVFDLATADFIPLLLKTPYGSRELIDWILQAKLCARFGEAVTELRLQGFRTIVDLENLDDAYLEQLALDTPLTLCGLKRAARATASDHNIERLKQAAEALGRYWEKGGAEERDWMG